MSTWLVLGLVFVSTVALGAVLIMEHHRWLLAVGAAVGGGLVATVVFSMSLFSVPSSLDTYYPLLVVGEFTVAFLLPLAIGSMLGLGGAARVLGSALLICATVAGGVGLTRAVLHPAESPESHLVDIAAHSATPVYYAGDRFNGHDLNRPVMFSQGAESGSDADRTFEPGDQLYVIYSPTCGECDDEIHLELDLVIALTTGGTVDHVELIPGARMCGPRRCRIQRPARTSRGGRGRGR